MNAKHTPGPWKVGKGINATVITSDEKTCIAGMIDARRDTLGGASLADIEANARLIAAAPELLAACQYVVEFDLLSLSSEQMHTLAKRCRDAINKATGNQP